MLSFVKEFILPYAVWALVMGCVLAGFLKDARIPLLLLALLVSLPNLRYPAHAIPLGSQTLTLLVVASLLGRRPKELLGARLALPAPQTGLLWATFIVSYLAMWHTSYRYGLPPPIDGSNSTLADWKNVVLMMLTYFAAYRNTHSQEDARRLSLLMLGVVLFLVLQNYRSVFAGNEFSFLRRAEGPFGIAELNSNHFGAFLAHYVLVALAFSMFAVPKWQRIAGAATFVLAIYPLFYTYSRASWVAVAMGLLIIGLCKMRSLVLVMLVVALAWQVLLPSSVVDRIQMTETEDGELESSAADRLVVWDKAVTLFKQSPILGIGFNGFVFETENFQLRNAHNYYLQLATEQGLVGLLLLLMLLGRAAWAGWRLFRDGRTEFFKSLGLGYLACTSAVAITNVFGDRFSQLALGTFFFLFMGMVDRSLQLNKEESVTAAPAKSKAPARTLHLRTTHRINS